MFIPFPLPRTGCPSKDLPNVMNVMSVDGCHAGWFAIFLDTRMRCFAYCYESFSELWCQHPRIDLLLIDIPIGLPHRLKPNRQCDLEARSRLGKPRSSSVFPPPSRAVFQALGYKGQLPMRMRWAARVAKARR